MDEQNTNGNGYFKGNIDARVGILEKNIELIMTNHLPHIQAAVNQNHEDMERKIDNVITTFNTSLEGKTKGLDGKMDSLKTWLITLLGTVVVSLILLALNLIAK